MHPIYSRIVTGVNKENARAVKNFSDLGLDAFTHRDYHGRMMLTTVDEVIDALGGTKMAAEAARVLPSAVSNWKARKTIPSDRYFAITASLRERGKEASPNVFGFHVPSPPEREATT